MQIYQCLLLLSNFLLYGLYFNISYPLRFSIFVSEWVRHAKFFFPQLQISFLFALPWNNISQTPFHVRKIGILVMGRAVLFDTIYLLTSLPSKTLLSTSIFSNYYYMNFHANIWWSSLRLKRQHLPSII